MTLFNFRKLALASTIAGLFLAGCGGGSDVAPPSTMLSGTVAGGAAVIGTIIVTDSKSATKGGTIEANGHYSIDVSGMTGPFILKAAGTVGNTSVTYYSAATTADLGNTVNVTPFTNLIVSNIAAQMAENYFSDPANIAKIGTLITPAKLAAAETALQAKLQPVLTTLGISDSIDLLRSTFSADHSGIDAVLDLVKVEVDTSTNVVTLKNALTQLELATDDVKISTDDATAADSTKLSGITTTAVTDLQAITTKLNSFAALFATGLPSETTIQNSGLFDTSSNFMMGGEGFAQFASEISTEQGLIGLKFSNVAIALDASGTSGTLTAAMTSNNKTGSEKLDLKMVKIGTNWLVQGDGRIADLSIDARAERSEWTNLQQATQVSIQNGLNIWVDPFSYNSSHTSAPVVSALVTGPGLGAGVTMVQDTQNTWLKVAGSFGSTLIPECGTLANGASTPTTTQCVNVAQALDNSQYTVVLKDGSGNSLNGAGYKLTLPKQPYVFSALTSAMFPAFTAITIDGQNITSSTVAANKSVAVSWTMPTGLVARNLSIWASTTTFADYFRVDKDLSATATSALVGLGSPLTTGIVREAGVWFEASDAFGRRLAVSKSQQFN